jgi:hypothetical protein
MRLLFATIDIQQDGKITKPELFLLFKRIWDNPGLSPFQINALYNVNQFSQNIIQQQGNVPAYYGNSQQGNLPAYYGQQQQPGQYGQPQSYGQSYGQQQQYGQPQYGGQQQYGQNPYGQNWKNN